VCIGERIWGLKKAIEEKRRKLNALMDQDVPEITDEILDVSYKLDILIKDYYYRQIEGKE
jgi:vacuolar-type H+-ATPase subunit D/Vma8